MKFLISMSFLAAVMTATSAFAAPVISDSLVKNLSCAGLSRDSVLAAVRDDAFSMDRHLPTRNWSSGMLGQCWSLSHAQRLTFFLGRFDDSAGTANIDEGRARDAYVLSVLMLYYGDPSTPLNVFPVADHGDMGITSGFFKSLDGGIKSGKGKGRDFNQTIEAYQKDRFFRTANLYLTDGERERSPSENAQSFATIQQNAAKHRITMIDLRYSSHNQHIVLVKNLTRTSNPGEYRMALYDSNSPSGIDVPGSRARETELFYNETTQQFTTPDVTKELMEAEGRNISSPEFKAKVEAEKNHPIGLFIVDEQDMDRIQDALFQYYQTKCGQ